jgi:hypothetical protein
MLPAWAASSWDGNLLKIILELRDLVDVLAGAPAFSHDSSGRSSDRL